MEQEEAHFQGMMPLFCLSQDLSVVVEALLVLEPHTMIAVVADLWGPKVQLEATDLSRQDVAKFHVGTQSKWIVLVALGQQGIQQK
jgi:hypothetical protein